jgi:uncharacterized FAD-dependent dehydrogenase
MSAHARNGEFTNAALVATVRPKEVGAEPLSGVEYQRCWERAAFRAGGEDYAAPAQGARAPVFERHHELRRGRPGRGRSADLAVCADTDSMRPMRGCQTSGKFP